MDAAGRELQVRKFGRGGLEWPELPGDKVVQEWIGADNLGLFIQLGVVDNPWPS